MTTDLDSALAGLARIAADICVADAAGVRQVSGHDDDTPIARFCRRVADRDDLVIVPDTAADPDLAATGFGALVGLPVPLTDAFHRYVLHVATRAARPPDPSRALLLGAAAEHAAAIIGFHARVEQIRTGADFDTLLASTPVNGVALWEMDISGGVPRTRGSIALRRMLGYDTGTVLELGPERSLVPDEDIPAFVAAFEASKASGWFSHAGRIVREDGSIRYVEAVARWTHPVLTGVMIDVTDRDTLAALGRTARAGALARSELAGWPHLEPAARAELDAAGRVIASSELELPVGSRLADAPWWAGGDITSSRVDTVVGRAAGGDTAILELASASPPRRLRLRAGSREECVDGACVILESWPLTIPADEHADDTVTVMGTIEVDLRTGRRRWSEQAFRNFGLQPGDVAPGLDLVREFTLPEDQEALDRLQAHYDEGSGARVIRHRIQRAGDGQLRTLELTGRTDTDAAGEPTRFVGTVEDVTEAIEQEAAVRRERERLAARERSRVLGVLGTVVEDAPVAIYVHDTAGRVIAANAEFHRFSRAEPGTLIGRPASTAVPVEMRERIRALDERVLAERAPIKYEFTEPGTDVAALVQKFPLADESGALYAVCTMLTDLTELRRHERQAQRRAELDGAVRTLLEAELEETSLDELRGRACSTVAGTLAVDDVVLIELTIGAPLVVAAAGGAAGLIGRRLDLPDHRVRTTVFAGRTLSGPAAEAIVGDADLVSARGAMALVPIAGGGDGGVLLLGGRDEPLDGDEITFAEQVARSLGAAAAREQSRLLREQLSRGERLEAVGKLAGGIAHDFNNLLAVILNYAGFIGTSLEDDPAQAREDLEEITRASRRGAELMQRLLVFSRGDVVAAETVALDEVIRGMVPLLEALVGSRCTFTLQLSGPPPIHAAPRQLEDAVMALVANAAEAMPDGGTITITTSSGHSADGESRVCLTVADDGPGMDAETRERAFDPFFTTKGQHRSAGLGLASVYGTVRQLGGTIEIDSALGEGTRVLLRLPAAASAAHEPVTAPAPEEPVEAGVRTVLLVEDEPPVRAIVRRVLERAGYAVREAPDAVSALALAGELSEPVDILLTDVVMPGISGRELALQLEERWPDLSVVFMSGYADAILVRDGRLEDGVRLLEKPFTPESLLKALEEAGG